MKRCIIQHITVNVCSKNLKTITVKLSVSGFFFIPGFSPNGTLHPNPMLQLNTQICKYPQALTSTCIFQRVTNSP